jgi:uncharacterized protein (UPF0332 family)
MNLDCSKAWGERARANLHAANQLLDCDDEGNYSGPAASRGYYALFQACVAVLLKDSGTIEQVSGVLREVGDVHSRTRELLREIQTADPRFLTQLFDRAKRRRVDADCHPERPIHEKDVRKLVDEIEEFIRVLGV